MRGHGTFPHPVSRTHRRTKFLQEKKLHERKKMLALFLSLFFKPRAFFGYHAYLDTSVSHVCACVCVCVCVCVCACVCVLSRGGNWDHDGGEGVSFSGLNYSHSDRGASLGGGGPFFSVSTEKVKKRTQCSAEPQRPAQPFSPHSADPSSPNCSEIRTCPFPKQLPHNYRHTHTHTHTHSLCCAGLRPPHRNSHRQCVVSAVR